MKYVIINFKTNKYIKDISFNGEEGEEFPTIEWTNDIKKAKEMSYDIVNLNFDYLSKIYDNMEIREI